MSHFPGNRLEDFLCWKYDLIVDESDFEEPIRQLYTGLKIVTKESFSPLVTIFEPHRESIEGTLSGYPGDDECSWRDWSGYAFDYVPNEVYGSGLEIVKRMDGQLTAGLGAA